MQLLTDDAGLDGRQARASREQAFALFAGDPGRDAKMEHR